MCSSLLFGTGSFAAARQSAIGNVEEGSCFADAQSEGAGGCCRPHCLNLFCLFVFGAVGGVVGVVFWIKILVN